MSYSRWTNSRFYTYWDGCLSKRGYKESEVFTVDLVMSFTYAELAENLEKCLDKVCEWFREPNNKESEITILERKELMAYMQRFLKDVDDEYKNIIGGVKC